MLLNLRDVLKRNYDLALFLLGLIIKFSLFHYFIGIKERIISITIINILSIVAIYLFISYLLGKRKNRLVFIISILVSTLLFVNSMYYSHFFTLMPIHSVLQIGQLGPVSNSIFSLIKLEYFLLFLDTILLWLFYKKNKEKDTKGERLFKNKNKRKKYLSIFLVLTIIITGSSFKTIKATEGNFTPQNLGVINYYFFNLASLIYKSPLDKEKVEDVIGSIIEKNGQRKGFSLAKDKNIIVIQAESLQNFVINKEIEGQEISPFLNQLINKDSIHFNNYYEQVGWGNTSDAEFVSHNSYYPSINNFSYMAYKDNDFYTLPSLLKDKGYSTLVFHGNEAYFWNREEMYPSQGLDKFISLEDFDQDEMIGIGLSDGSMFNQSIDVLKKEKQPFYSFYITLTSHHPFELEEDYKELDIKGEFKDTLLEDYLQTIHYLDKEIGNFIKSLKEEGLYDNSLIAIYGDHEGLDLRNEEAQELLSSFLGESYREDEMCRVPLIVHIPGSNYKKVVEKAGGQIDFFPTIGNLIGLEIDSGKVFGKDLLNVEKGFVANQVHVSKGSFIDDEKIFIMSEDGIFENGQAWNIKTRKSINVEECREGYERALGEINLSEYILQNNLVPLVWEKGLEYIVENAEKE